MRRSFKSIRNISWTFLFPIFMMFTFSFRWGIKGIDPEYMSFLIPGIVAVTAMFGATNETMNIVWDRALGTFDRIVAAPVSPPSIILGKMLSGTVMGFVSAMVLMIIGKVLYNVSFGNVVFVVLITVLSCFSFTGVGTIISGFSSEPREALMLSNALRFPMMLLSGVFFPIEAMPVLLQWVARVFPLTYATEAIRTFSGQFSFIVWVDIAVLLAYTLTTMFVGSKILLKSITG